MFQETYEILERTKRGELLDRVFRALTFNHVGVRTIIKTHEWHNEGHKLRLHIASHPIITHQFVIR